VVISSPSSPSFSADWRRQSVVT
jgi:hypothetical protein